MNETTNKTKAVVATKKKEVHKSIFDDELLDDVFSYDPNEFNCAMF